MKITRRSLTLGAPFIAVTGAIASARAADTSPIIIGYPAALTGPSSAPGVGQNRGVTYIVEQINAAGGVKGRKIEMVTRDTQGDPTKAVNAVQEMMANDKVHAIFGPNNSGEALATTPIIARRGIPNIHCCGITSLIDEKKFPNAFRQTPNNDQSSDPPRVYCQKGPKAEQGRGDRRQHRLRHLGRHRLRRQFQEERRRGGLPGADRRHPAGHDPGHAAHA